jgi:hypothetical protein
MIEIHLTTDQGIGLTESIKVSRVTNEIPRIIISDFKIRDKISPSQG